MNKKFFLIIYFWVSITLFCDDFIGKELLGVWNAESQPAGKWYYNGSWYKKNLDFLVFTRDKNSNDLVIHNMTPIGVVKKINGYYPEYQITINSFDSNEDEYYTFSLSLNYSDSDEFYIKYVGETPKYSVVFLIPLNQGIIPAPKR